MRGTKLGKITLALVLGAVCFLGLSAFVWQGGSVQKLSLKMMVRTLYEGKSVSGDGAVYYDLKSGLMVTQMTSPFRQLIFTNAVGEYKNYDMDQNTVTIAQNAMFSTKESFFYSFLSGQINDMGLASAGYRLTDTRFEENLVVKEWSAPADINLPDARIEVVYENYLPIYLGTHNAEDKLTSKTYYTNYQSVSYLQMPFTITEISYGTEGDSIITQRKYSDLKVNNQVDNTWLNFQIPSDAKVIDPAKEAQKSRKQ